MVQLGELLIYGRAPDLEVSLSWIAGDTHWEGLTMAKGSITKRGDRAWRLTYDAPRGSDGKRNQKAETCHGTKKQASARMAEIQNSINKGTYFEAPRITVVGVIREVV